MPSVPGTSTIGASAPSSFHCFSLFSSPTVALTTSSVVALVWAFQQHGWSYCIPCVIFVARKIAGLPFAKVRARVEQAVCACTALFLSPFATSFAAPDSTLAPRLAVSVHD